ncbi:MAG: hypothetical protein KC731_20425, partial [Myxococcales bacterium]|nr:hypothetical protein [Myxococcales bacterium]
DDAVDLGGGLVPSQGGVDFFVVKLSPTGSLVWGKVFGGPGDDLARRLAVSAMGEVLVAGAFFGSLELGVAPLVSAGLSDGFVLRLDASTGDLVRAERFGDEEAQAIAGLAVDGAGDVVVAGSFSGTIDFGGGELTAAGVGDAFVAKRSSAGAHRWSARFGLGGDAQWVDVALTPSGDAVVGGDFDGAVDLGSGPLASNGRDVMLVELDGASGAPQIGRVVAGAGRQEVTALAVDGSGHLALSGRNLGTVDFGGGVLAATNFVVTTSASGEHVWSRAFGTTDAAFEDVTFDAAGGVVVVGSLDGSIDFGGGAIATTSRDAIVVRFHQSGAHLWSHAFGAGGSERAQAVAVDTQGRIVVAGSFTQAVDFGGGVIGVAGASDLFFLQLAP